MYKNRSQFKVKQLLAGKILLLFVLLSLVACEKEKEQKPNVIFILTDQWRVSALGYAGNDVVKTPELDKFSLSAVNFKMLSRPYQFVLPIVQLCLLDGIQLPPACF